MKYLLFIVLLVAAIITAGCVGGNQNSVVTPSPTVLTAKITLVPSNTPTPTQHVNTLRENDNLFKTKEIKYLTDLYSETNKMYDVTSTMDAATISENVESWGYWANKLKSTCSDAKNELSPISVSPEFQPVKDECLGFFSDYEKSADSDITAIEYVKKKDYTSAVKYIKQGQVFADSGKAKLNACTQLLVIYNDKISN